MNNWSWILVGLAILNLWLLPFVWGNKRKPWGWINLIDDVLTLFIVLKAFNLI